jgi:hypothetical protein
VYVLFIKKIDKLDFTSIKENCLGYSIFKKGYKCYDPKTKKLFISRDVIFLEKDNEKSQEQEVDNSEEIQEEEIPLRRSSFESPRMVVLKIKNSAMM